MRTHTAERSALIAAMVAIGLVVLVSNIAVQYPIGDWLTWGAFTYPLAFLVTDLSNRILGASSARRVVYAGFAVGVALSFLTATDAFGQRIAVASGAAFLTAQLLDVWIFNKLRQGTWWRAPLVSSLVASALDTAIFFAGAFAMTQVPWVQLALGDYAAKLAMAALLLVPFRALIRLLPAEWQEAPVRPI